VGIKKKEWPYRMNTDAVGVRPVIGLCFRRFYEVLFFKFLSKRILMPEYKVHLFRWESERKS